MNFKNLSSRNFQVVTKDRGSIAPKLKIKYIKPYSNNELYEGPTILLDTNSKKQAPKNQPN